MDAVEGRAEGCKCPSCFSFRGAEEQTCLLRNAKKLFSDTDMTERRSGKQHVIKKKYIYMIVRNIAHAKGWNENAQKRCFGYRGGGYVSRCLFAPLSPLASISFQGFLSKATEY